MFDLATIKRINNQAVAKFAASAKREKSLRAKLKKHLPANRVNRMNLAELEDAAYYIL